MEIRETGQLFSFQYQMTNPPDILLVEDNEDDVDLTVGALKKHITSNILVCGDGAEALDYLFGSGQFAGRDTSVQPRLVLLDLNLPKLNGIEVLMRLRADLRTEKVPVVMLTSSVRKADLDAAYAAGANSYLVKAVNFADFTKDVQQLGQYWLGLNKL
jgi:two-component system response regulator